MTAELGRDGIEHQVVEVYAAELHEALRRRAPVAPLTDRPYPLSVETAYRVSRAFLHRRLASDEVVGRKVGLTSVAVQQMLGIDAPDFGVLLRSMQVADGAVVDLSCLIQPRIEAEVAFVLDRDLGGDATPEDVLAATRLIVPALEIVDSRIADWRIRLADTVADNASCGLFVLGSSGIEPRGVDLAQISVEVLRNGRPVAGGNGTDVMGTPLAAVAWLARTLASLGDRLSSGDIILSGSMTPLLVITPGDRFEAQFPMLGRVSVEFA